MKYCIVAPYRDRITHLSRWQNHYKKILPDIPLYVIEQADTKHFNRAKLFNAFFLEEGHKYDYVVYHDVDWRIMQELCDVNQMFSYPETPIHLGHKVSQFNFKLEPSKWKETYPTFFGGVCVISKEQMETVGGWANDIWSWGHEDDEMYETLSKKYEVKRRPAYFMCEDHKRPITLDAFKESAKVKLAGRQHNNLENCSYEVVARHKLPNYELIKVSL